MNRIFRILIASLLFAGANYGAYGQAQKPPVAKKIPPPVTKLANLIITDIWFDAKSNLVWVDFYNNGPGDAGTFTVRVSIKKKGEKTYLEKRVSGMKATPVNAEPLQLVFKIGQPLKDLEIGFFVDSKNEIKETDEINCGLLTSSGGVTGNLSCEGF